MQENRQRLLLDTGRGYFRREGVNVMAFDDIYPEGHQSGVSILMHGRRIATCGDVRFEPTPGQWQPVPKQLSRRMDEVNNEIVTSLRYPDEDRNLRGMNPMIYPDAEMAYTVRVRGDGEAAVVTVDLEEPLPEELRGIACFNLELFPGVLFGQPWVMDGQAGIFPRQPNGPLRHRRSLTERSGHQRLNPEKAPFAKRETLLGSPEEYSPIRADDWAAEPYAEGRELSICPNDPLTRLRIECVTPESRLRLYDGRMNHNNGWFTVSSLIPAGRTEGALQWRITPNAVEGWRAPTVIQVSQVGYHPDQAKCAVLETDPAAGAPESVTLYRVTAGGEERVKEYPVRLWGNFLRGRYYHVDFTDAREEGLCRLACGGASSTIFRVSRDIYERGVWQPVLEYFLPVQMCHMLVREKYRVWHGLCHRDDARMAPTGLNHFDGYVQGPSTLCSRHSGEHVPGLNAGGWHDAGDFDLRVESQSGEVYILSLAWEEFRIGYDATAIDQQKKLVEIHEPDGKPDILQQIEHGMLSVVGGWKALGRLYRGIICGSLRQYVLLGDAAAMTDGEAGNEDDRWVFTEENPARELTVAAHLAAAARALAGFNDTLAGDGLEAAEALWQGTPVPEGEDRARAARIHAAAELWLTTRKEAYRAELEREADYIAEHAGNLGWIAARVIHTLHSEEFSGKIRAALPEMKRTLQAQCAETPYGIPYRPYIWGAGWGIQAMAFRYYFLLKAFPEVFDRQPLENALNFVLGCHPGSNTASFASGVGTRSATTAYGANRADWSYIPGGVVSGTALIRPDFPELLEYPFLWQQTEYVLGGGSSNYMFLVLAVRSFLTGDSSDRSES